MSAIAVIVVIAMFLLRGGQMSGLLLLLGAAFVTALIWTLKLHSRHTTLAAAVSSNGDGSFFGTVFGIVFAVAALFPLTMLVLVPVGLLIRTH